MGRRSHTRALGLWMNGTFVDTWRLSPQGGDALQYDAAWQSSAQGRPLSLSLPFLPGNAAHHSAQVRSYFENLLPDSREIRERVARRFGAHTTEAFDLLAEIGRDCVGALQVLPEGIAPTGLQEVSATPLREAEVARILRGTVAPAPMGLAEKDEDFRISIAGAQEKAALLHHEGQWCLPHGATPTTHIFKLPMGLVGNLKFDLRDSVENEWLCAQILDAYGVPVAACEPLQFEDMKVLCVARFDRRQVTGDSGQPMFIRLPQEDMCQANGVSPFAKYEADGGPGMERIMKVLDGSSARDQDRRTFFQAQVIFWMLCATDGHAKNFSLFLRPGGRYHLTPLYDVLSAYPILGEGPGRLSPFKARMAMALRSKNAHWKAREIQRRHWLEAGERFGVLTPDGRPAAYVVDDLAARTPEVVRAVRQQLPTSFPTHLAASILGGLQDAADKLAP